MGTLEKPRPVLMRKGAADEALRDPERIGYALLVSAGAALVLVGMVELGLLWYPAGFGYAAWEFGTLSQTFDAIPTTGLGLALLAYAFVRRPNAQRSLVRTTSMLFAALALALLLAGLLFARAVPSVFAEAPAQALEALRRSIIRTGATIAVCFVACVSFSGVLWRGAKGS